MKKGIALLLTVVYLLATAGTAVLSLTCGCAERKAHAEHVCLSECRHDVPDHEVVRACCGCELHSTEVELYISQNSGDDERHIRCTVIDLPPALAAECPCPAHVPFLRKKVAERRPPARESGSSDTAKADVMRRPEQHHLRTAAMPRRPQRLHRHSQ